MNKTGFKLGNEVYLMGVFSVLALLIINVFQLDFVIADGIYALTNSWYYQEQWFTSVFMHLYMKYALILLYLVLLLKFFLRDKSTEDRVQRYGKIVLLTSLLLGTLTVSYLKHTLQVDCPWDLVRYGGDKPYFALFSYGQTYLPSSHCFPSGHASSVFTWLSLYFYTAIYYPKHRLKILLAILVLGYVLGLGQQFRGAHFLSHDIWSMLVCLMVNLIIYKAAFSQWSINKVVKK
ncbi:MAG: phosphatase PAP2 family protein [Methylococcales bacterium]